MATLEPTGDGGNPYSSPENNPETGFPEYGPSDLRRTFEVLRQTRPWVRFISIMMFLAAILLMVMAIILMFADLPGLPSFFSVIYIGMGLLCIVPAVYLFQYASRINIFMAKTNIRTLDSALESQRSFWRFVGIVVLIILMLYLTMIPVTIVVSMLG